jgi:protein ImuB
MRGKTAPGSAGGFGYGSINRRFKTPGKAGGCRHLASNGTQIVAVCSTAAAEQGIRPGMPVAEAQALVPQLTILPHEPAYDRHALAKLAEACEQFSPCVALEEGDDPESLLLDISNLEHLWGSEAELAAQVEKLFTSRGYHVRLAIAGTVGAAWALAHFGAGQVASAPGEEEDCKMQIANCKFSIAERRDASNNNLHFAICNLQFAISSLPIEALRISPDIAALLRQLGIQTIGQLQSLPRKGLTSRFGGELLRRLDQLTGAASEMLLPHRALAALEVGWSLDEPTTDRAMLTHVLRELVERLSRQLAARDQGAVLLMCWLRCTGARSVPLEIGLLQPTASAEQLMELVELHLERVRLAAEVGRIDVRVAVTGRLGERQGELFAGRWLTDPHQVALLVNRLSSRLGHDSVLCAELRKSPVPERAVRYVPLTSGEGRKLQNAKCKLQNANWGRRKPRAIKNLQFAICNLQSSPRPVSLYTKPEGLEVVCVAPDGPPEFVWLAGRRQRIVHHAGPERIETLWWRGPAVRRDYYRVALESGSHLWIFRRLTDRRWFLQGAFA